MRLSVPSGRRLVVLAERKAVFPAENWWMMQCVDLHFRLYHTESVRQILPFFRDFLETFIWTVTMHLSISTATSRWLLANNAQRLTRLSFF